MVGCRLEWDKVDLVTEDSCFGSRQEQEIFSYVQLEDPSKLLFSGHRMAVSQRLKRQGPENNNSSGHD